MAVDSSSGAIGNTVDWAIEEICPLIAAPAVPLSVRQKWLDRLWKAIQKDEMPYIEYLGEHWGMLCASPKVASSWADKFLPALEASWLKNETSFDYFKGTNPCLSAMLSAARYEELLN